MVKLRAKKGIIRKDMDISGMEKQVILSKLTDLKRKLEESLESIELNSQDERLDEKVRAMFLDRKQELSAYLSQVKELIKRIE